MNKYIDADKLIAEIERLNKENNELRKNGGSIGQEFLFGIGAGYADVLKIIESLQQEQPDYKEAVQLVFEEELTPFKDGNQWCFLLGHNIQDGICGFGDTILDAAVAFYNDYTNTRTHIGELKISMAQQEQPEVDLEKIEKASYDVFPVKKKLGAEIKYPNREDENFSKREIWKDGVIWAFYELGLNAKKEEGK